MHVIFEMLGTLHVEYLNLWELTSRSSALKGRHSNLSTKRCGIAQLAPNITNGHTHDGLEDEHR